MKLISVIIPAYNAAQYIADAINSVLSQMYKDYEIIVVDDGSTDDTASIVKNHRSSIDKRPQTTDLRPEIRYIYQKNAGPSSARNRGIKEAKGKYIAFLDADDEWDSSKLEKQVRLLNEDSSIGLVTCGRKVVDESGNQEISMPIIPNPRKNMFKSFVLGNIVGSCSCVIIKKTCVNAVGYFDESLKVGEDWDLWLRVAKKYDVASVNEPLVKYNVRPNSQSGSGDVNLENELRLLKKIFGESDAGDIQKLKNKAYSYRYYKAAIAYRENGNIPKMKNAILKAIAINPFSLFDPNILFFFMKNILRRK